MVGFTIISNSEPAVLSSEHFFASVNGVEPHAISITVEPAVAAEAVPIMKITAAMIRILALGGMENLRYKRRLDRALLTRYDTNAAQAPNMNSASASSTFAALSSSSAWRIPFSSLV